MSAFQDKDRIDLIPDSSSDNDTETESSENEFNGMSSSLHYFNDTLQQQQQTTTADIASNTTTVSSSQIISTLKSFPISEGKDKEMIQEILRNIDLQLLSQSTEVVQQFITTAIIKLIGIVAAKDKDNKLDEFKTLLMTTLQVKQLVMPSLSLADLKSVYDVTHSSTLLLLSESCEEHKEAIKDYILGLLPIATTTTTTTEQKETWISRIEKEGIITLQSLKNITVEGIAPPLTRKTLTALNIIRPQEQATFSYTSSNTTRNTQRVRAVGLLTGLQVQPFLQLANSNSRDKSQSMKHVDLYSLLKPVLLQPYNNITDLITAVSSNLVEILPKIIRSYNSNETVDSQFWCWFNVRSIPGKIMSFYKSKLNEARSSFKNEEQYIGWLVLQQEFSNCCSAQVLTRS